MKLKNNIKIGLSLLALLIITSCVKDEDSILKIFVKSSSNTQVENATVRIVGDLKKETPEYLKEELSNENGVAIFKLDDLYDGYSKDEKKVAYFKVYLMDTLGKYNFASNVKTKANITSTETVYLKN